MSEFKFSVGDRVAVRCSVNGYYRGTIKSINRYSWVEHPYVIIKDVNDKYYYTAKESELTRLVKKNPWGGFKVGDKVRTKNGWEIVERPSGKHECGIVTGVGKTLLALSYKNGCVVNTPKINCVRLRKKPKVFAVGDRVLVKNTFGAKDFPEFKSKVIHIETVLGHTMLRVDNPFKPSNSNWIHVTPSDCVKLRKRRLRVGDRVSALPRGVTKKVRGVVLQDDKTENPFLILVDKGDYYLEIRIWCKETECKRLARKKKIKSQIPDCKSKYPRDWFEYLKFVTALFGNKNNGDNKDHASASGKRVECQCMQSGCVCGKPIKDDGEDHIAGVGKKVEGGGVCKCSLFVYRSDKPTICIHCNGHLDSSSEKPAKEICNPALWETQQIKNIATSKLINELIRKVERLESTNPHLTCWQCGGIANKPAFYRECVCGAEHK